LATIKLALIPASVRGFAVIDPKGRLVPGSVRTTPNAASIAGGSGTVVPVRIQVEDDPLDKQMRRYRMALRMAREDLNAGRFSHTVRELLDELVPL
jgi:hypothetical protein